MDRRARWSFAEVQRGGDYGDSDKGEADGARNGGQETAAHQWNICAEPGW